MNEQEKTKTAFKLNTGKIIALVVIAVFVLFYIGCNLYLSTNRSNITTEITMLDTQRKTVSVDMIAVRDESVLTSADGNIVSAVKDGTRVSSTDTVAYSFADSSSASTVMRIAEVEEELEYYNSLVNKSSYITDNTTAYDNKIIDSINDFSAATSTGDFSYIDELKANLRDTITSRQTATGVEIDVTDTINALNAEHASLKAAAGRYSEIKANGTGYYISGVDGCEDLLDYNAADEWTVEQVEKAISASPSAVVSNQFGKLVNNYYWYIACVVDTDDINQLRENKIYTVGFYDSSVDEIKCTVKRISSDAQSGKSLVVFSCNMMSEELAAVRTEHAYIVLDEYKGYRVDSRALRTNEDNEPGVYVLDGSTINFKKVEIIYSDDSYTLVTSPFLRRDEEEMAKTKASAYLSVYDEYVVTGHDLYDGKILK
ncbi:MAG: hypothetical protein IJZ35_08115 [Clostridia bacterium]|nr:hypothetical protein [Clostridia bacterium]